MRAACASAVVLCLCVAGCDETRARAEQGRLVLTSPAFAQGETIPIDHTCDGADQSPRLEWSGVPGGARSLVLLVTDPDAPGGTFTHWVVFDIPPEEQALEPSRPEGPRLANGATQGLNDFESMRYRGPCPPHGATHRYVFRLYALDTPLALPPGSARAEVEEAMRDRVLGVGELVGVYERVPAVREPASSRR